MIRKSILIFLTLISSLSNFAQKGDQKPKNEKTIIVQKEAKKYLHMISTLNGEDRKVAERNLVSILEGLSRDDKEIWMAELGYKKIKSNQTKEVPVIKNSNQISEMLIEECKGKSYDSRFETLINIEIVKSITNNDRAKVNNLSLQKSIDSLTTISQNIESEIYNLKRKIPEDADDKLLSDSEKKIHNQIQTLSYEDGIALQQTSKLKESMLLGKDSYGIDWNDDKTFTRVLIKATIAINNESNKPETRYFIGTFNPKRQGFYETHNIERCQERVIGPYKKFKNVTEESSALNVLYFPIDYNAD